MPEYSVVLTLVSLRIVNFGQSSERQKAGGVQSLRATDTTALPKMKIFSKRFIFLRQVFVREFGNEYFLRGRGIYTTSD